MSVPQQSLNTLHNTGVIFASNHLSEWDPILVTAALPWISRFMPLFYISHDKSHYPSNGWRKYLYGGLFFKAWGAYPAYRGLKNYEKSLSYHIEILSLGGSLCVFPEGGKSKTGKLGEGRPGVAFLAQHANVPVVPVLIQGIFKLSLKDFLLRRKTISFRFGEPLFPKDLFGSSKDITLSDYKVGASKIMDAIKVLQKHDS